MDELTMTSLGWNEEWGVNGVLPGGGRCAACHLLGVPHNYLLCQTCWDRLPQDAKDDLTRLWGQIRRKNAGTIADIRGRQTLAVDAIEHVPPAFDPHLPFNGQEGADVFRRIRPDAVVTTTT